MKFIYIFFYFFSLNIFNIIFSNGDASDKRKKRKLNYSPITVITDDRGESIFIINKTGLTSSSSSSSDEKRDSSKSEDSEDSEESKKTSPRYRLPKFSKQKLKKSAKKKKSPMKSKQKERPYLKSSQIKKEKGKKKTKKKAVDKSKISSRPWLKKKFNIFFGKGKDKGRDRRDKKDKEGIGKYIEENVLLSSIVTSSIDKFFIPLFADIYKIFLKDIIIMIKRKCRRRRILRNIEKYLKAWWKLIYGRMARNIIFSKYAKRKMEKCFIEAGIEAYKKTVIDYKSNINELLFNTLMAFKELCLLPIYGSDSYIYKSFISIKNHVFIYRVMTEYPKKGIKKHY